MSVRLTIRLVTVFLFLQINLSAQDKTEDYIKEQLPELLTKDADAVCRLSETIVEVKSPGKIIVSTRNIYTILDEKAERLSTYYAHYDKLSTLYNVEGTLFNAQGKEIKHFKKKDMSDYSADGAAFVSDDRIKVSSLKYNTYPYTVAFNETEELAGTMYIPDWLPGRSSKMSLSVSRYSITVPAEYKFRYKIVNSEIKPVITTSKDKTTYTWEIKNLPVIEREPFAISSEQYNPFMLVGPTNFELQGYTGNMSEWSEYGKFYASLQKGRDVLPDDVRQEVHKLTDTISNAHQKISTLYDYLQRNTHYVSISLGIGGLQTYDAAYVARNKYGDCKALSNYMISLLKEAGIRANAVIIYGDEEEPAFFTDFPSHQFNHVICAVPLNKDTVWLECTAQYLPAGYLGVFTANRYGLFINEDGGKLVHTPAYLLKDNTSIRKLDASMDEEGNVQLKSTTVYRALSHDPIEGVYHNYSKDNQLEWLKSSLTLPTYTVNSFNYQEDYHGSIPAIEEMIDLSVNNYAHVTGKRAFLNPDILRRSDVRIPEEKNRKLDFQFNMEYSEIDSVTIRIPSGYETESRPKDILLKTKFGLYNSWSKILPDRIIFFRQFDQYRGRFPASSSGEIREFYNSVYDGDHNQIVLVRKN